MSTSACIGAAANLVLGMAFVAVSSTNSPAAAGTSCKLVTMMASDFTHNLEGWTSNTPSEIKFAKTGGNPAGFVKFTDVTDATTYIDAPASFHGSYSDLDGAGYITYQHNIISQSDVNGYDPYEIRLSGPNGAAKFDGSAPTSATTGWVTVVAPLVASDWTVTSGTWSGLLANVTDMQIDIELVSNSGGGTDVEGIDNVAVIKQPCGFYTPKS